MIKKYKEFSESTIEELTNIENSLKEYITIEDIEDQFLRLKEVLNHNIQISFKWSIRGPYYQIIINPSITRGKGKSYEELEQIINRIKEMYPKIVVYIPGYVYSIYSINIELKESYKKK